MGYDITLGKTPFLHLLDQIEDSPSVSLISYGFLGVSPLISISLSSVL